ncbi:MAG: protein kinase domain-containing protein [Pirellula sp.]|nr:protein kinase [Pirellula sp.]
MTPDRILSCSVEELRSYDSIEQVDIICSAFELFWKKGTQLNIRECVSWVDPACQKEVLHELMLVEKECREFHPPVQVEAPNEFLLFDSKLASAGTIDNFSNDTIRTESKPNQLPLYIDRFAILRFLGRGSYGDVYEAEDVSIHRRVAVKVATNTNRMLRSFAKEAENANKVGHPSIVRIYEVGTWRGLDYLVSELIDGRPLGEFQETANLDPIGCARIVSEIADAIAAAHAEGVIHRDLKPSNIMIEVTERIPSDTIVPDPLFDRHRVRVLDFGISKLDGRETKLTRIGDILGTPQYMSPEQAAGRADSVDGRSDIYSMGVILFELLTGKLPFEGSESVVINSIRTIKPPRVRSIRSDIPLALDSIVSRCLEIDPANRYKNATELASDLEAWIDGRKPRSIAIDERRRFATGVTWAVAVCVLIAVGIAAMRLLPASSSPNTLVSKAPSATNTASVSPTNALSSWVRQGNLSELSNWLADAKETTDGLIFSNVDDLKFGGELAKAEAKRLEFANVCIADKSPSETESQDVLLSFMSDLELSQVDSLGRFLTEAPKWMVGSIQSLPKTELEDTKRQFLYRGLCKRLQSDGDGGQLMELLRLSETAELPYVLSAMIVSARNSPEWNSTIREKFDHAKMDPRQATAELDSVGRWKAKCALVAYGLGEMSIVDDILGFSQVPQARNYFIYWLSQSGLSLDPLLERMGQYDDDWRSTGVVATMGLVPKASIDPATLDSWAEQFRMWYRAHRSAGAHTGIRLMLQKWGHDKYVNEVDALPEFRNSADNRNWFMNSQGMQMNIVRGPVEFWFGSSPTARDPGSVHRIDYSFAYSDQIVSEVQYARFRPDRFADPKHQPAIGINFFDSIAYCDWLSAQEGLATGESVRWIDEKKYELNFLDGGYRPPTVWEWECFARAGTSGSFEFGEPDSEYTKSLYIPQQNVDYCFGPIYWEQTDLPFSEWSSTNAGSIARRTVFDALFHPMFQKSGSIIRSEYHPLIPTQNAKSSFRLCFPFVNK